MDENIFNITSNNQQGGITAGIIHIFNRAQIQLSDENKRQLIEILGNKSNKIHVSLQVGGSNELTQFAQDVKNFLVNEGYKNIRGVHSIMGFAPFKGVNIEKKSDAELVIFIGSLL